MGRLPPEVPLAIAVERRAVAGLSWGGEAAPLSTAGGNLSTSADGVLGYGAAQGRLPERP